MRVDTVDVQQDETNLAKYRAAYSGLARRCLRSIKENMVGALYKCPGDWNVYHLEAAMDTYPAFRGMLDSLGYHSFDTGLDIGCGTVSVWDFIDARDSYTVELTWQFCKFMHRRGTTVTNGDIEHLPLPTGYFDLVVCSDIFEHVLSFELAYAEARRVLKSGGLLLVSVPWKQDISKFKLSDFSHLRRFDETNLEQRFAGMRILARRVNPPNSLGWIGQIYMVLQ